MSANSRSRDWCVFRWHLRVTAAGAVSLALIACAVFPSPAQSPDPFSTVFIDGTWTCCSGRLYEINQTDDQFTMQLVGDPAVLQGRIDGTQVTAVGSAGGVTQTLLGTIMTDPSTGNATAILWQVPGGAGITFTRPGAAGAGGAGGAGGPAAAVSIAGTWQAIIANTTNVYQITQTGNAFTWTMGANETATGQISGTQVTADVNVGGLQFPVAGTIILDPSGKAIEIQWQHGVTFTRAP